MTYQNFMPEPRIPASIDRHKLPDPAWLDSLAPNAGGPIRDRLDLRREVHQAIQCLRDGRPGGQNWARAVDADNAAVLSGKPLPKRLALEILMDGENGRYARAAALAKTASKRLVDLGPALAAVPGLREVVVERYAEQRSHLADACTLAWRWSKPGRSQDHAEGWANYNKATRAHQAAADLLALLQWMDGQDTYFDPKGWAPHVWEPETIGHYLASEDALHGRQGHRVTWPKNVTWPAGHDLARTIAGPGPTVQALAGGAPTPIPGS